MAKIYIDYEDTRVNSNLKEAINYLGNANNIRLDVPTGFSRSSDIRQIDNSVGSVYTDLNNILKWLENSQKNYDNFVTEAIQDVSKIEKIKLKSASSIVK